MNFVVFFVLKSDLKNGRVAYRPLEQNEKCDVKVIHQTCNFFGLDLEVAYRIQVISELSFN